MENSWFNLYCPKTFSWWTSHCQPAHSSSVYVTMVTCGWSFLTWETRSTPCIIRSSFESHHSALVSLHWLPWKPLPWRHHSHSNKHFTSQQAEQWSQPRTRFNMKENSLPNHNIQVLKKSQQVQCKLLSRLHVGTLFKVAFSAIFHFILFYPSLCYCMDYLKGFYNMLLSVYGIQYLQGNSRVNIKLE